MYVDPLTRARAIRGATAQTFVRATCYDHLGQAKAALDAYQKFLAMNTDQTSNEYFEATGRVRFLERMVKEKGH